MGRCAALTRPPGATRGCRRCLFAVSLLAKDKWGDRHSPFRSASARRFSGSFGVAKISLAAAGLPLKFYPMAIRVSVDVTPFGAPPIARCSSRAIVALAVDDAGDGIAAKVHVRTRAHRDPGEPFALGAHLFDPLGECLDEGCAALGMHGLGMHSGSAEQSRANLLKAGPHRQMSGAER